MAEYRMKTGGMAKKVTAAYQKMENGVVGTYQKIEDAFVDAFLEKVEEEKTEEEKKHGDER